MSIATQIFGDMQGIIDAIPNPVFVKDKNHRIVLLNDSACDLFAMSRETVLTKSDTELFLLSEVEAFHRADDLAFTTRQATENEEQFTDAVGQVRNVITRKRLTTIAGEDYLVVSVTDVSALREMEERNRYLAFHDPLTGLPNRALLARRIDRALSGRHHGCALLYIDLDRFKEVNDAHGHPAGDELIREFAARLSHIVRSSDTVARLGGDEFAVLLSDTSKDPDAAEISRRVLVASARAFRLSDAQVSVGASIGVVLTGMEPVESVELQRRADLALYQAKNDGRGCFRIFTHSLDDRASHRREMLNDLRDALTSEGLDVYYQPLVDVESGVVKAFEALARWNHPVRGTVPPNDFIPIAEASGLILELGEWVLARACKTAASWDPKIGLSVNVSPIQFATGELDKVVERVLAESGFDPERLELEITEGVLTQDPEAALNLLDKIRAMGVQIVLDDFGTGYSSLQYFRQFPFDKIKIDRSFTVEMVTSRRALAIVQAVISLAHGLDLLVVAEGVETEDELALLKQLGCAQAQGYFLGRPMPGSDVSEAIASSFAQARAEPSDRHFGRPLKD